MSTAGQCPSPRVLPCPHRHGRHRQVHAGSSATPHLHRAATLPCPPKSRQGQVGREPPVTVPTCCPARHTRAQPQRGAHTTPHHHTGQVRHGQAQHPLCGTPTPARRRAYLTERRQDRARGQRQPQRQPRQMSECATSCRFRQLSGAAICKGQDDGVIGRRHQPDAPPAPASAPWQPSRVPVTSTTHPPPGRALATDQRRPTASGQQPTASGQARHDQRPVVKINGQGWDTTTAITPARTVP